MKKVLGIIYIVILLVIIKLFSAYYINEKFISNYNNGNYKENDLKGLFIINIFEPCIVHYNYANVLYKENNFTEAITEYKKALSLYPTMNKECDIRINLALAMLMQIDEKDNSYDNIERTLQILNDAKKVLCEHGCANENDDNGHSIEAEKLKKDIERKESELQQNNVNDNTDTKETDSGEEERNDNFTTEEEKLKNIQKKVTEERQEDLDYTLIIKDYKYYNGKKW